MAVFEIGILGAASQEVRQDLECKIQAMVGEFGLSLGSDVILHDADAIRGRDPWVPRAIAYFCGATVEKTHEHLAEELAARHIPVIPVVESFDDFPSVVPTPLQKSNGIRVRVEGHGTTELAAALLECAGLLRAQRRVFISYRRAEASPAAIQLHDLFASRGFDVFLDTHDVRPAEPFQEVLWHRLCDSDVMVMLDTPNYFQSKWTVKEYARARARGIFVLRVVWPEHTPDRATEMAESIQLGPADLEPQTGRFATDTAHMLASKLEEVRSRSIAARYLELVGRFRAEVEKIGGRVEGVGAHWAIAVRVPSHDLRVWAYPVIGIPTAETLNDVLNKSSSRPYGVRPVLVYDHVGIRDKWLMHLRWLDINIRDVRAVKVSEAAWELAGGEL